MVKNSILEELKNPIYEFSDRVCIAGRHYREYLIEEYSLVLMGYLVVDDLTLSGFLDFSEAEHFNFLDEFHGFARFLKFSGLIELNEYVEILEDFVYRLNIVKKYWYKEMKKKVYGE